MEKLYEISAQSIGRSISLGFLVVLMVVLGILHLVRVSSTRVNGTVTASEVGIKLSRSYPAFRLESLRELSLSGFDSTRFNFLPRSAQDVPIEGIELLSSESASGGFAGLRFRGLPAGTYVRVNGTARAGEYEWAVTTPTDGTSLQLEIIYMGRMVARVGKNDHILADTGRAEVTVRPGTSLYFTTVKPAGGLDVFSGLIPADELSFDRSDPYDENPRKISTVREGTIIFAELQGREFPLVPGIVLSMQDIAADIHHFSLADSSVQIAFSGTVGELRSGPDGGWNLMPRRLERLRHSSLVALLGATLAAVLGYAIGIRGWLGR